MTTFIDKQIVRNQITTFVTLLQAQFDSHYANIKLDAPKIVPDFGRKYCRIWADGRAHRGQKMVYCFIDLNTGGLLKAATWAAPASGVRGSIFNPNCDVGTVADVYGGGFYKK